MGTTARPFPSPVDVLDGKRTSRHSDLCALRIAGVRNGFARDCRVVR